MYDYEASLVTQLPDGPSCLCSIETQKKCETALDITIVVNRDNNHGVNGDGKTVMVKTDEENYHQTMKLSSSASVSANCATSYTAEQDLHRLEVHTSTHDQVASASSRPDNYCGLPKLYRNYCSTAS